MSSSTFSNNCEFSIDTIILYCDDHERLIHWYISCINDYNEEHPYDWNKDQINIKQFRDFWNEYVDFHLVGSGSELLKRIMKDGLWDKDIPRLMQVIGDKYDEDEIKAVCLKLSHFGFDG